MAPHTAQKNPFQYALTIKKLEVTSMLNKTPPIGAPNVAETPAAAAAPNKSRRSIAFFLNTFNPEIGKLFNELPERYKNRAGGYVRILKKG